MPLHVYPAIVCVPNTLENTLQAIVDHLILLLLSPPMLCALHEASYANTSVSIPVTLHPGIGVEAAHDRREGGGRGDENQNIP